MTAKQIDWDEAAIETVQELLKQDKIQYLNTASGEWQRAMGISEGFSYRIKPEPQEIYVVAEIC